MTSASRKLSSALRLTTSVSALVALTALGSGLALAGPEGESVVSGVADVTRDGALTRIDQASERALLDWRSFNIGKGERVDFRQPGASSLAVNRVTGGGASTLAGQLTANGSVWLLNPQGVLIGKGAQLNTNGFLASSASLSRDRFDAGDYTLSGGAGPVENRGSIRTGEGGTALAAPVVVNEGDITSTGGQIALAAGTSFTVDMLGGRLLGLTVTEGAEDARVEQSGEITAEGGSVDFAALAYGEARRSLLNLGGVTRATRVEGEGGKIRLTGGETSRADISGTLEAPGGRIEADAEQIAVQSGAKVDASSSEGDGGTIAIGRRDGEIETDRIAVAKGAEFSTDSETGKAGTIDFWSETATEFRGKASALGPEGDAVVDISSRGALGYSGEVQAGKLLFDPTTAIIAFTEGSNDTTVNFDDPPDPGTLTIDVTAIDDSTTPVQIQATEDIDVQDGFDAQADVTLEAGRNILINDDIDGDGDITLRTGVDFSSGSAGAGGGGEVIVDNIEIATNGTLTIEGAITGTNALIGGDTGFNLSSDNPSDVTGLLLLYSLNSDLNIGDGAGADTISADALVLASGRGDVNIATNVTAKGSAAGDAAIPTNTEFANGELEILAAGNATLDTIASAPNGSITIEADGDIRVLEQRLVDADILDPPASGEGLGPEFAPDGFGSVIIEGETAVGVGQAIAGNDVLLSASEAIEILRPAGLTGDVTAVEAGGTAEFRISEFRQANPDDTPAPVFSVTIERAVEAATVDIKGVDNPTADTPAFEAVTISDNITGTDTDIRAKAVTFEDGGDLSGSGTALVQAEGDIRVNEGGMIDTAAALTLETGGNIIANDSIFGEQDTTLRTGVDFESGAAAGGQVIVTDTVIASSAQLTIESTITGQNAIVSGGSLDLSGNAPQVEGTLVLASLGSDLDIDVPISADTLSLASGGDVNITADVTATGDADSPTPSGGTITNGDLEIRAGGNINIDASVSAPNGSATLAADDDINDQIQRLADAGLVELPTDFPNPNLDADGLGSITIQDPAETSVAQVSAGTNVLLSASSGIGINRPDGATGTVADGVEAGDTIEIRLSEFRQNNAPGSADPASALTVNRRLDAQTIDIDIRAAGGTLVNSFSLRGNGEAVGQAGVEIRADQFFSDTGSRIFTDGDATVEGVQGVNIQGGSDFTADADGDDAGDLTLAGRNIDIGVGGTGQALLDGENIITDTTFADSRIRIANALLISGDRVDLDTRFLEIDAGAGAQIQTQNVWLLDNALVGVSLGGSVDDSTRLSLNQSEFDTIQADRIGTLTIADVIVSELVLDSDHVQRLTIGATEAIRVNQSLTASDPGASTTTGRSEVAFGVDDTDRQLFLDLGDGGGVQEFDQNPELVTVTGRLGVNSDGSTAPLGDLTFGTVGDVLIGNADYVDDLLLDGPIDSVLDRQDTTRADQLLVASEGDTLIDTSGNFLMQNTSDDLEDGTSGEFGRVRIANADQVRLFGSALDASGVRRFGNEAFEAVELNPADNGERFFNDCEIPGGAPCVTVEPPPEPEPEPEPSPEPEVEEETDRARAEIAAIIEEAENEFIQFDSKDVLLLDLFLGTPDVAPQLVFTNRGNEELWD